MKLFISASAIALTLLIGQSALADVGGKPKSNGINVATDGVKRTTQFKIWKSNVEVGDKVGKWAEGIFCTGSQERFFSKGYEEYILKKLGKSFFDTSASLGYPKFEGEDSAFAEKLGMEADFKIGMTLVSLNFDACGFDEEMSGNLDLKIRFEMFSTKTQKIVYSKTVDGKFSAAKKMKTADFYDSVLSNALDKIFSDVAYVNLFRDGNQSQAVDGTEKISFKNGRKSQDGVRANSKEILNSVVTVESGLGSGTGFYIGKDGYIVSNYHVVGEAKFVKIRFPSGQAIVGSVVRKDSARDVALIKTESEPLRLISIGALPAKVSEEVFAVGSPFGEELSGTITRGIVSAERVIDGLKFIQSDVSINPGNSGGPLVNSAGQVVAIAVLKKDDAAGIALFIPIAEALDKLGLSIIQ